MDRAVRIPGTRISLGLDAILGLFPGLGDVATGFVQAIFVLVILRQYRIPQPMAARMAANVLIDMLVGTIPFLGDLFDVSFKANTRNLKLLQEHRSRIADEHGFSSSQAALTLGGSGSGSGDDGLGLSPVRAAALLLRPTAMRYLLPIALIFFTVLALIVVGFITVVRWLISG
jgi:hypothetical protein